MNISGIIITRNEQNSIQSAISSLSFAKEVIIIDNNSTDSTPQLAKESNARVFTVSGLDFSYLRNVGKEKATGEWLFYIDADERPTKDLIDQISVAIEKKTFSSYSISRQNYFFGEKWGVSEKMIRLIRKDALIGWQGSLHETPIVAGKVGHLSGILEHFTHGDLKSMVEKTNEWSEIESRLRYKNNHPEISWWRFLRVMITTFCQSLFVGNGWKSGTRGLIEAMYQSYSMFITYAKLWEKQHKTTSGFLKFYS